MRRTAISSIELPFVRGRLCPIGLVLFNLVGILLVAPGELRAQQGGGRPQSVQLSEEGTSSRDARETAIRNIPFTKLTADASQKLRSVVDDASFFRRMPVQAVDCDPQMYTFLVRHPEVVVGIWDLMGITKVALKRMDEYRLQGNDGAGTTCNMDLIYGSDSLHIYHSHGAYSGNLWARELKGKCVVILHNKPGKLPDGSPGIVTWMDAFMKLDNIGADLVVKTLGPLVGKTADHNFTECAGFFTQISQTAENNPQGLQQIGKKLVTVQPKVREEFVDTGMAVAIRATQVVSAEQALNSGIAKTTSEKGLSQDKSSRPENRVSQVPADVGSPDRINSHRILLPITSPADAVTTAPNKAQGPSAGLVERNPTNEKTAPKKESGASPTLQLLNAGTGK